MPQTDTVPATQDDHTVITQPWPGPFGGVPQWDRVTPAMFPAAFEVGMAELRREYAAIRDDASAASFASVILPMQRAGDTIDRVHAMWGVYSSNLATAEVQAIDREWSPRLTRFYDEVTMDPGVFARVKAAYEARDRDDLDAQQTRLLERTYRGFVRRGALLDQDEQARVSAINQQLSSAFNDFGEKLLADEETWTLVTDPATLAGLGDDVVASLAAAARERGLVGHAIVNTRSSVQPVLMYASDRGLRRAVWERFVQRGDNGDANDTNAVVVGILALRHERARLLGFANHATYRLDDSMAQTPAAASALMHRVWPAAVARVGDEVVDMQGLADAEGTAQRIEPWDYRYYAEKVRKRRYDLDESEVKPYLQLDNIVAAAFYTAGRLFDLGFAENTGTIPVFDPAVRTFAVTNTVTGAEVGIFYFDGYARSGKRSGAWATWYRGQHGLDGPRTVLASNNNNFLRGAPDEPMLIGLDDAATLFHEFGHAVHSLLQDVTYPGLASTPRDFVELPSQLNENWLLTRDVLDRFAKHYRTGEPMPAALVDKIGRSSTFNQGFRTVEYLSSALIDMAYHDRAEPVDDPAAFEAATLAALGMPAQVVMRHRTPQFQHVFGGDSYSAGYYSYLWAEVMDADTWALFEERGVWDKPTADALRTTLLATGNESDRAAAYRAFRGHDPDAAALFARRGFPAAT